MSLFHPLLKFMALVCVAMLLLIFGAKAWGRAFPGAMLYATALHEGRDVVLLITDLAHNFRTEIGNVVDAIWSPPIWSNDARLAFFSDRSGSREIYIWDGESVAIVPQNSLRATGDIVWSPDGRLTFISADSSATDIYMWDGITLTNITQNEDIEMNASWSDDGRLAYVSIEVNLPQTIVWDGATFITVANSAAEANIPAWSSDGRLAFTAYSRGKLDIQVWDGETITNISRDTPGFAYFPAWSSDGRLAFVTKETDNWNYYLWHETTLTRMGGSFQTTVLHPIWSNDNQLVFVSRNENTTRPRIYLWDDPTEVNSRTMLNVDMQISFDLNNELYVLNDGIATKLVDYLPLLGYSP